MVQPYPSGVGRVASHRGRSVRGGSPSTVNAEPVLPGGHSAPTRLTAFSRFRGGALVPAFLILAAMQQVVTQLVADPVGAFGALAPFTSVSVVLGLCAVVAHLVSTVVWTDTGRARFARDPRVGSRRPPLATGHLSWLLALGHRMSPRPPPAGTWER